MKVNKWKWVLNVMTPIIPTSVAVGVAIPLTQNSKIQESKLMQLANNPKELSNFLDDRYERLSTQLKSDQVFLDWTSNFEEEKLENVDKTISEIEQLDLSFESQAFLLQNYLEKVKINQQVTATNSANAARQAELAQDNQALRSDLAQTSRSNAAYRSSQYGANTSYLYLKGQDENGRPKYENVRDKNNNLIPRRGYDKIVTNYGFFRDDVTEFYWSNQTILNYGYGFFGQKLADEYEKAFKDMQNSMSKQEFDEMIKELNKLTDTNEDISSITNSLEVYTAGMKEYLKNILKISKQAGWITRTSSRMAISAGSFSLISLAINMFKDGIPKDYYEFKNQMLYVISNWGLGELAAFGGKQVVQTTAKMLAEKFGQAVIGKVSSKILTSSLAGPIGAMVGMGIMAILSFIPSGNGHSIMSNFDDHGLNDWDFQLSNNTENMLRNAINWSNDYKYGVMWRVMDGWFYTPRLAIVSQGGSNYRIISGTNIFSNDFNWGRKIKVYDPW